MPRLKFASILEAVRVIDPVFLHTPQYVSESLSALLSARIVVKVETANPVRCFKGRGSEYFVSRLPRGGELITASAGNLGQAMAYSCRKRGVKLTVYAGVSANAYKLDRIRAFGAEVVQFGKDFDAAKAEARRVAMESGIRLVEDSLDVETGEGAGTIGLELAAFPEKLDAVVLALGNGALACGTGCYFKHSSPGTRIVSVQAAGAPAMTESFLQNRLVRYETMATIADGIGVRVPIAECVEDMRETIDETLLVSDESILTAMRLAHQHLGLVLEPSGAAALAAVMENRERFAGQTVAAVLCGGNLTPEQMRTWLG